MRRYPSDTIPEGWYQVGWSADYSPGSVLPLHYFDRDLVSYRAESGELVVLDAYCMHYGAHLGHGGTVEGTGIRCPMHGWKYSADGQNVDIPYSSPDAMGNLRLTRWAVREVDELILVWFSPAGGQPRWEPQSWVPSDVEFWDADDARRTWPDEEIPAQVLVENAVDSAHFRYVHTAASVPDIEEFSEDGPSFRTVLRYPFGAGKDATWATPYGPVNGRLSTYCHGLGFIYSNLRGFDDIYHVLSVTPISARRADIRATVFVPKTRGDRSVLDEKTRDRWIRQQHNQVSADIVVWSKLSFRDRPPFAKSEAHAMRAFKKWCKQFYVSDPASAPTR